MDAIFACPAGWLLEALTGHPLDHTLFVRRSLWWRYHPDLQPADTADPMNVFVLCDCDTEVWWTSAKAYTRIFLASVEIRRTTGPVDPTRPWRGLPFETCLFWAGQCPWCKTIDWTVSPWTKGPES